MSMKYIFQKAKCSALLLRQYYLYYWKVLSFITLRYLTVECFETSSLQFQFLSVHLAHMICKLMLCFYS